MMAVVLFLFTLGIFAWFEALRDAETIRRHEPIDHGCALIDRIMVGLWLWVLACAMSTVSDVPLWHCVLLIPAGWAWWTMVFRYSLNRMRGLDWRYISPSSWYDWQFLRLFGFWCMERGEWIDSWSVWSLTESARRAGMIAYAFEAVVFTASLVAYAILP